jgi:hypothetical protein
MPSDLRYAVVGSSGAEIRSRVAVVQRSGPSGVQPGHALTPGAFERFLYGAERVIEVYYNAQVWRGISVGAAWQLLGRPGYDSNRGAASVLGLRLHVEEAIPVTAFTKS